jgi:pimeloyl-ACP methyl ester carboxylesterase
MSYKITMVQKFLKHSVFLLYGIFIQSTYGRSLARSEIPSISWGNCTASDPPNLDCGIIQAPIDYDNPNGPKVNLTIARIKANGTKIGNLFFNFGGPGGEASTFVFETVKKKAQLFSPELLAQYDILGLDPRGIGMSNPLKCDQNIWNARTSTFPETEDDFQKLVARNKAFSTSCRNQTGPLADFMDTLSVVKDFDLARQAVGDEKLNFLGLSYGTVIGQQYAEQFSENVGRFVLDGVMDRSQTFFASLSTQSSTYESSLNKFFTWCNTTDKCALHGKDVAGTFNNVVDNAARTPIPAPGCTSTGDRACRSDVSAIEILEGIHSGLEGFEESALWSGWPALSVAIEQAAAGNATTLSSPLYITQSSGFFGGLAVLCADWTRNVKSLSDLKARNLALAALYPNTRGWSRAWAFQATCIGWDSVVNNPQHALDAKKAAEVPEMLLVNSLWDSATSVEWVLSLKEQLPNSKLVLRNGIGHTSYLLFGNTSRAIDSFLLQGVLPADNTVLDS